LSRRFLEQVGRDPSGACLALAKTVARTLEPPPPSADALRLDRIGLFLQAACFWLLWSLRGVVLSAAAWLVGSAPTAWDFAAAIREAAFPRLLLSPIESPSNALFAWASAALWLTLESGPGAEAVRTCRSLPFRYRADRSYVSWHLDGPALLVRAHGLALQIAIAVCCLGAIRRGFPADGTPPASFAAYWTCAAVVAATPAWSLRGLVRTLGRR